MKHQGFFQRKVGESYVNFRFDSPYEIQTLCHQEIPPRGVFTMKLRDCEGRQLILDIQKLQPKNRVTYHLLMGYDGSVLKSAPMRLNSQKDVMRFEFTKLSDTIKFTLINPSLWRTIHMKLTVFEGQPWQYLPTPPPDEVIRVRQKSE